MSESIPETSAAQVAQPPSEVAQAIIQASLVPWTAPADDSRTIFKELTSAKGKKYRVGREIPENIDKEAWIAANSHLFDVPVTPSTDDGVGHQQAVHVNAVNPPYFHNNADVHWPYVKNGGFKIPDQTVIRFLHITEYNLDWNSGGWKDYILTIKSNKVAQYTFYDEEGDYYNLDVGITAWRHSVTYDSYAPNIVRVYARSETSF